MTKAGESILRGAREALDYAEGEHKGYKVHVPDVVDVKAIRQRNGLSQAKIFHQKFGLTGLVVTKLDGTSKGGVIVSIYRELGLPIFYLGLGEQPDDLQPFSVENYLDSLFPASLASMNA